jgi:5-methylcytosine-specific restriction endonuclease McrA
MLQTNMMNFVTLSNDELRAEVARLARLERQATAALIRSLMEVDARRLYLADGYSSLFTFCTQVLHLSEHAALGRIEVARAARRLPALLSHLEDGSVTVTNARLLAPHLTEANCEQLLASARHRSKREVEELVAKLRPQPDVRSAVRRLPSPPPREKPAVSAPQATVLQPQRAEPVATPRSTPPRPVIASLAPERYKIQFTASKDLLDKLRHAQDLLRHVTPSGDVAVVFERALGALIEQLEKQKCGLTTRPRKPAACAPGSRHIPAAVRREVWRRDGGRCAFVGMHGRCHERAFLEFHHVVPFATGGPAESSNIQLRCRAHNRYEADLFFSADVVREPRVPWGETVWRSARTGTAGTSMGDLAKARREDRSLYTGDDGDGQTTTGEARRCGRHRRAVGLCRRADNEVPAVLRNVRRQDGEIGIPAEQTEHQTRDYEHEVDADIVMDAAVRCVALGQSEKRHRLVRTPRG